MKKKPRVLLVSKIRRWTLDYEMRDKMQFGSCMPLHQILNKQAFTNEVDVELLVPNLLLKKGKINPSANLYDQLKRIIISKNPDYIGFETYQVNYVNTILLAQKIKKELPNVKIFLTEIHASNTNKETLKKIEEIDYVIKGETEKAIPVFSKYIVGEVKIGKVPNLTYRKDGEIKSNKSASLIAGEELPLADYREYIEKNNVQDPMAVIQGGRGCPYKCKFCASSNWSGGYRRKTNKNLIKEIKRIKKGGIERVMILQDNFIVNRKKLEEFCELVDKLNISWACWGRVDNLDKEILKKMKNSGCSGIIFGIESGNKKMQKTINKNLDLNHADEIISYCSEIGIQTTTSFIIGFPKDTRETLEDTIQKIFKYKNLGSKAELKPLIPFKGSIFFEEYKDRIIFDELFYTHCYKSFKINEEEELELIKKSPALFSFYYRIEMEFFSDFYKEFLVLILTILNQKLPKTTYKLYKKTNKNYIDIINQIVGFPEKKNSLTREEFLNLPELEYKIASYFYDHQDDDIKKTFLKEVDYF